jgi:hypothetical protein
MSTAGARLPEFQLPYTAYGAGGQNGRVAGIDGLGGVTPQYPSSPFGVPSSARSATGRPVPDSAGFRYPTETEATFAGDMLRGNWEHSPLSAAFFTRKNSSYLQSAIKQAVARLSGPKKYQIDDQDVDELKMIMRAMYLQYSKNQPFNIEGQVQELNQMVVDWAAPRIISEITQYEFYLNDISHLPVPMEKPLNVSSAGTRSLAMQPHM